MAVENAVLLNGLPNTSQRGPRGKKRGAEGTVGEGIWMATDLWTREEVGLNARLTKLARNVERGPLNLDIWSLARLCACSKSYEEGLGATGFWQKINK